MANPAKRAAENVAGDFFVDRTCIDCDACRQIAPDVFLDHGGASSVYRQPASAEATRRALMALVACPTGSIGVAPGKYDARAGIAAFPSHIAEDVYFCGFTAEASFGAWSYLVVRPSERGGNVLIDSPRFAAALVRRIGAMGGIRAMLLTHSDDIADHDRYARRFGATRFMHKADGATRLGVERVIEGDACVRVDDDIVAIPVPGHTRGSMMFLYRNKFLFTGDSLAWSPEAGTLTASKDYTWYSWKEQTRSLDKLSNYNFEWVLPGHGRIGHSGPDEMRAHLRRCVARMRLAG